MAGILVIAVLLFIVVVAAGAMILIIVANRKWGYTPEREQELEELPMGQERGHIGKK